MLKRVGIMSSFSPKTVPSYNARSISFPARSHPHLRRLEAKLNKLGSLEASPSDSLKAETVCDRLSGLGEIYGCVEDLLHLPLTQQAALVQGENNCVNSMLDDLIKYLDICGNTRDVILLVKESVRDLQSCLRRSKGSVGELSIESDLGAYNCSRKNMKKEVTKCLATLKRMDNNGFGESHDKVNSAALGILREASLISISVFSSLLTFLSVPISKSKPKPSKWSLVSRLVHKGMVVASCEGQNESMNELESVDVELTKLWVYINQSKDLLELERIESALGRLEVLDATIEEFEKELECLFRRLIQIRVSLLNLLSQ